MDLAWSKANLISESSAEPLKKKPRSVSRDLCYVTDNYESSVCWILSCLKRNACLLLCAVRGSSICVRMCIVTQRFRF